MDRSLYIRTHTHTHARVVLLCVCVLFMVTHPLTTDAAGERDLALDHLKVHCHRAVVETVLRKVQLYH